MTHPSYEVVEHWIMRHYIVGPNGRISVTPEQLMSGLLIAYRYGDSNGYDDGYDDGLRRGESETLRILAEAEL